MVYLWEKYKHTSWNLRKNQLLPRAKTCTYRTTFRKMNKNNSLPPEGFPLRFSVCATSVGFPFSFRLRSVIWFGSGGSRRTLTCFVGEDIFFPSIYVGSVKRIVILRQDWIRKSHSRPLVSDLHLRFNGCLCELHYARALSARFPLTGGRFNYERTVGEKNSPQWLPRSGALREQRHGATRKEKQIMMMYKRIESKENARTLWMATGSFVFRGLVLYHSLDLLSWQPSLWKTFEQSPRLFPLFFFSSGTGGVCVHRLTQPNLEAFVFNRHLVRHYQVRIDTLRAESPSIFLEKSSSRLI